MKNSTADVAAYNRTVEEIANHIQTLSQAVKVLLSGRLKTKTVVTLLAYSTQMPRSTVEAVLAAIGDMEKDHLK